MRINSEVKYLTFASTFSSLFTGRLLAIFSTFSFQELTKLLSNSHYAQTTLKKHTEKSDHSAYRATLGTRT